MIIINAEGLILGRLASYIAKKALEGEKVTVVNAEKAVITGKRSVAIRNFKRRIDLHAKGNPFKGPQFSRMPDRMFRHAVKGMLPTESSRGRNAFRNVMAYIGLPEQFEKEKVTTVESAKYKGTEKFVTLGEMSRDLGAKW